MKNIYVHTNSYPEAISINLNDNNKYVITISNSNKKLSDIIVTKEQLLKMANNIIKELNT